MLLRPVNYQLVVVKVSPISVSLTKSVTVPAIV